MCSGNRRNAMGHSQSYLKKEQERLGDTPRMRDQIPADASLGTQFAANFVDMTRPPVPKKTIDYSKPRTIKDGTTVSGRQTQASTGQRNRRLRPTRMGRRTGTDSLRIPLNSNRGTGNLNY